VKTPPDVKLAAVPGVGHIVASRSVPGAFRLVYGTGCTCPAPKGCWHIAQVLLHVNAVEETKRQPPVPVNKAALLD
jgi:hypothetical protein